jgi:hypothetical protein
VGTDPNFVSPWDGQRGVHGSWEVETEDAATAEWNRRLLDSLQRQMFNALWLAKTFGVRSIDVTPLGLSTLEDVSRCAAVLSLKPTK